MEGHPELERGLERLGLLRPPRESAEPEVEHALAATAEEHLLSLCDEGRLLGGLSFARGVMPDEAFGPLCQAIGGGARRLRLVDVVDRPVFTLSVARDHSTEQWVVPSLRALILRLQKIVAEDAEAFAPVVLGEVAAGALQIWCVPRGKLSALRTVPGFREEVLREEPVEQTPPTAEEKKEPGKPRAAIQHAAMTLQIESPEDARREIPLGPEVERFDIGRSRSADLTLDYDEVERSHASLVRRGGWRIRPGVGGPRITVNGVNVDPGGLLLSDGDQVMLGPVVIRIRLS